MEIAPATLAIQRNEKRCRTIKETHTLPLAPCCPMSGNPLTGSEVEIQYSPREHLLEVQALRLYVDSYIGGRGDIRSMEGMIQQITQDCADALQVPVWTVARLNLDPNQRMTLECSATPSALQSNFHSAGRSDE